MTVETIEPSAVYPPSGGNSGYTGGQYYVINDPTANQPRLPQRIYNRIPQQPVRASIPTNLPSFLRANPVNNRAIVFNAWIVAMIVIGFDEWHNLHVLPRPTRLWDASLVYAVLIMLGFIDPLVPIANALAVGYTFMLIWQYFQGNITPQSAMQQAENTLQPVGYQGVATVPASTSANPTG